MILSYYKENHSGRASTFQTLHGIKDMELYKMLLVASTVFFILWVFTTLAEDSTFPNKMLASL